MVNRNLVHHRRRLGIQYQYQRQIFVWNYFTLPEGKTQHHNKMELNIWNPCARPHQGRYHRRPGCCWTWNSPSAPTCPTNRPPWTCTRVWRNCSPRGSKNISKVHPGKNVDDLMEQGSASCTLVKGEVRRMVDRLAPETNAHKIDLCESGGNPDSRGKVFHFFHLFT